MTYTEELISFENRLITAVKSGQAQSVGQICSSFTLTFSDISVAKKYCIEINALLRKAAEMSGVPIEAITKKAFLILNQINNLSDPIDAIRYVYKIAKEYSTLVVEHSEFRYSSPVIKALAKIDSDIKDDLSLKSLAKFNNISAGYFSGLFKKEMGITLTDYVNQKRIIIAKELLVTTRNSVTDISKSVGIDDTNYFIKVFKKYEGKTPREYRESI